MSFFKDLFVFILLLEPSFSIFFSSGLLLVLWMCRGKCLTLNSRWGTQMEPNLVKSEVQQRCNVTSLWQLAPLKCDSLHCFAQCNIFVNSTVQSSETEQIPTDCNDCRRCDRLWFARFAQKKIHFGDWQSFDEFYYVLFRFFWFYFWKISDPFCLTLPTVPCPKWLWKAKFWLSLVELL